MTLQEENEMLRERVRQLEVALGATDNSAMATKFGLSASLMILLQMMVKKPIMLRDAAMLALYGHYADRDTPDEKIIDIFISQLRKKMEPFGVKIITDWGRGYYLSDESKKIIADLVAAN